MDRVVLPEISRSDIARDRAVRGPSNTWLVEGGHSVAQRTRSGFREFPLEAGRAVSAHFEMAEREVRYDYRSGRYAVMVGGKVRFADLEESVVMPSRRIVRQGIGIATLSGQSVVVGPPSGADRKR